MESILCSMVAVSSQTYSSVGAYLIDLQSRYVSAMQRNSEATKVAFFRDCAAIVGAMRARFRWGNEVPRDKISDFESALESGVREGQNSGRECVAYADAVIENCAVKMKLVRIE